MDNANPEVTLGANVNSIGLEAQKVGANKVSGGASGGAFSAEAQVSNMGQLKELAPDVYEKMMLSMANDIIRRNNKHIQRMKQIARKYRQNG